MRGCREDTEGSPHITHAGHTASWPRCLQLILLILQERTGRQGNRGMWMPRGLGSLGSSPSEFRVFISTLSPRLTPTPLLC